MAARIIPLSDPIAAVWNDVPDVGCKGLCQGACGPIAMTRAEYERLADRSGRRETLTSYDAECPYLDSAGRCSAYAHRPLICRLYGAAENLRCQFGCEPERWVSIEEAGELFARIRAAARDLLPGGDEATFIVPPPGSPASFLTDLIRQALAD